MKKIFSLIFIIFIFTVLLIGLIATFTKPPAPTPVEVTKIKETAQQMETLRRGDLIEYSNGAIVRVCYAARGTISLQRIIDIQCLSYTTREAERGVEKIYRYNRNIGWIEAAGKYLGAVNANFSVCCTKETIETPKQPSKSDFAPQ